MATPTAFSDSNDVDISGGSSSICCVGGNTTESPLSPESDLVSLKRLSHTLESIFLSDSSSSPDLFDFFADARLVAPSGREIPVHRCILSARSPFFRSLFSGAKEKTNAAAKVELKELMKERDVSFDALLTVLAYLYSGRVRSSPEDVCICVDDECPHVACRPAMEFMVEVLYASFIFQVPELVAKFQEPKKDIQA